MRLPTPVLITILAATFWGSAGCHQPATRDPFAREEPQVEFQGLAVVAAGALGQVGLAINNLAARATGTTPRYLAHARTLANPEARPDELREAMMGLTRHDFARQPPYTDAYANFARHSPHALVRATAIRALNISRDETAIPLFIERIDDVEPRVRLEAAKALSNMPSEEAITPLLARASDAQEQLDVRIAAIDALKHYQRPEPMRALVRLLEADDFSLVWQARRSLVTVTGEDHGFSISGWRRAVG